MIGSRFPRLWVLAVTLGVTAAVIMLAMFFGQSRWLANRIVTTSSEQHYAFMQGSFERRARSRIHMVTDTLPAGGGNDEIRRILQRALGADRSLVGIRFKSHSGQTIESGSLPTADDDQNATTWLAERLVISYPVIKDDKDLGYLTGAFLLDELQAEKDAFAKQLTTSEVQSRVSSYYWIVGGTLIVLALCGSAIWLMLRSQSQRVEQLKLQAEKFRDADFGEPLSETGNDDLGELAAVFNDMRDRLRKTTLSRDYVDNILSGMNEAIIVTGADGKIQRINTATKHLLGYDEDELLDAGIDFIIDSNRNRSSTPVL